MNFAGMIVFSTVAVKIWHQPCLFWGCDCPQLGKGTIKERMGFRMPLTADNIGQVETIKTDGSNVVQPLAIWGHAKPCTPPRLQNLICAASPSW